MLAMDVCVRLSTSRSVQAIHFGVPFDRMKVEKEWINERTNKSYISVELRENARECEWICWVVKIEKCVHFTLVSFILSIIHGFNNVWKSGFWGRMNREYMYSINLRESHFKQCIWFSLWLICSLYRPNWFHRWCSTSLRIVYYSFHPGKKIKIFIFIAIKTAADCAWTCESWSIYQSKANCKYLQAMWWCCWRTKKARKL